ncbi:hypothetical protein P8C59_007904 [Phyllachora maydis]|uniref:Zinc finger PHD-type domain-containing protein n=1 Tax=Phyllachora maydis TaxID=1825666 RepID=A0AAD9MG26_9PEZI|nr:hypothetical protein P8C59_007904 [Phyllachora maydis]
MPAARKRTLQQVDAETSGMVEREPPSMLQRIRNMWQFANLFQFVMLFGKALKIDDDFDIDDFETECLNPQSTKLQDIGLSLLKFLSSQRGLTNESFDEYTRRQFEMKAPEKSNPFGPEPSPNRFADFDIYTKLRVLHRMTQFVMMHPERLRERTEEQRDSDQTNWRIEPYGWDSDDRTYYVLDDNRKTRDDNQKILRDRIVDHLVPILEKQEESNKRKLLQREKELLNLEKMAHAKRSSRLAKKVEHQREEEKCREEEKKRREEELAAKREEQKRLKMERERDNRLMGRERRLKEREARRRQHEEELARLSEDGRSVGDSNARLSERQLQAAIARKQEALKELKKLDEEEEEWMFDCICGVHGKVDDGTHSVACECCNVWQHSKCLGFAEDEAEQANFHFICATCRKQGEAGKVTKAKIIKLKVNRPNRSSCPAEANTTESTANQPLAEEASGRVIQDAVPDLGSSAGTMEPPRIDMKPMPTLGKASQVNGDSLATATPTQPEFPGMPAIHHSVNGRAGGNPFSSPHPALSPPDQSPNKSKAYGSIFAPSSPATKGSAEAPKAASNLTGQPINQQSNSMLSERPSNMSPQDKVSSVATKKSSPVMPMPDRSPPGQGDQTPAGPTPVASFTSLTPGASHLQTPSAARNTELPSPVAPSQGGVSPTKHSPPIKQHPVREGSDGAASANGRLGLGAPSPIQPPVTLSPSPQPRTLTPPVKSAEPAKGTPAATLSSPNGGI